MPGIGKLTALTYVLTLGGRERFTKSREAGAYLGLRPKQRQSGERDPELGIAKNGDSYLRSLLVECAHHVLSRGPDSTLKRWGLGLSTGGTRARKRALVAVAANSPFCCIVCGPAEKTSAPSPVHNRWRKPWTLKCAPTVPSSRRRLRYNRKEQGRNTGDCVTSLGLPGRS